MTYDQAIQQGYAEQVEAVNKVDCDFSGRQLPDPSVIEFRASHQFTGADGYEYTIEAYYYQDADDMPEDGDLGSLEWTASRYEIV
jgi:hypothetical protein